MQLYNTWLNCKKYLHSHKANSENQVYLYINKLLEILKGEKCVCVEGGESKSQIVIVHRSLYIMSKIEKTEKGLLPLFLCKTYSTI